jgi:hypothetical protein
MTIQPLLELDNLPRQEVHHHHGVEIRLFSRCGKRLKNPRIVQGIPLGDALDGKTYRIERQVAYNPDGSKHKCNSSCQHAKGETCECSCGGANHGIKAYA